MRTRAFEHPRRSFETKSRAAVGLDLCVWHQSVEEAKNALDPDTSVKALTLSAHHRR